MIIIAVIAVFKSYYYSLAKSMIDIDFYVITSDADGRLIFASFFIAKFILLCFSHNGNIRIIRALISNYLKYFMPAYNFCIYTTMKMKIY